MLPSLLRGIQHQIQWRNGGVPYQFTPEPLLCHIIWTRREKYLQCGYV